MISKSNALKTVFGERFSSIISSTFAMVTVCEEEIDNFINHNIAELTPDQVVAVKSTFLMFGPLGSKCNWSDHIPLFRKHINELLWRVIRKEDLDKPTDAEVLCVLSQLSLVAPPGQDMSYLFHHLFYKLFGKEKTEEIMKIADLDRLSESYEGAADAIRYDIERKLKIKRLEATNARIQLC